MPENNKGKASKKKQGSRKTDVSAKTLRQRPNEFPGQGLRVLNGQLFCEPCSRNVGSGKQRCKDHCETDTHKDHLIEWEHKSEDKKRTKEAIIEWNQEQVDEGGSEVIGSVTVSH